MAVDICLVSRRCPMAKNKADRAEKLKLISMFRNYVIAVITTSVANATGNTDMAKRARVELEAQEKEIIDQMEKIDG